ncbi:MAG: hypothetical protein KME12_22945 [Trichocoleus desertorum ATA4-8-CV12]|jgi:hypothetical protein|nr:hypothetical protein [Trichocoleus desertorum ATA4-8-CV12]
MSGSADELGARIERARRGVQTANELLSEARGNLVTLYRAISEMELKDVLRYGDYCLNPHGSGKYFALDEAGARRFASTSINDGLRMTITSWRVPEAFLEFGDTVDDPGGAIEAIHFSDEVLPDLYRFTGQIEIIDAPWVPSIGGDFGQGGSSFAFRPDLPTTPGANSFLESPTARAANIPGGAAFRGADRVLGPLGYAMDAYELKEAYEADGGFGENFRSTAGGIAGSMGGAAAGAKAGVAAGAAIGALFGGVGAAPGAVIGGLVGSIAGGIAGNTIGSEIGENLG